MKYICQLMGPSFGLLLKNKKIDFQIFMSKLCLRWLLVLVCASMHFALALMRIQVKYLKARCIEIPSKQYLTSIVILDIIDNKFRSHQLTFTMKIFPETSKCLIYMSTNFANVELDWALNLPIYLYFGVDVEKEIQHEVNCLYLFMRGGDLTNWLLQSFYILLCYY